MEPTLRRRPAQERQDYVVNLLRPPDTSRVLFVDDRRALQRSFKRTMSKVDVTVTVCDMPDQGLAALEESKYSVVLISDDKPALDAVGFLDEVRIRHPEVNRILVSGRSDLTSAMMAINKVGLFSFVVMPWEPNELRDKVRRACDNYMLRMENRELGGLLKGKAAELAGLAAHLEVVVQNRTTSLLLGLNAALDLRDTETQSHSRRVALYAKRLAEEIGLPDEEVLTVERGSLLHDIGKIGVSDTILLKPGKLTEEEWEEMRKHAAHGYQILEGIDFLGDARVLVHQHHERWDGKGYPQGLSRTDIFIGARIFAVIDTYDAITSDRPYRKGRSHEVANEEIEKMSGSQFDPSIVGAWLQIPKKDIEKLQEYAKEATAGMD